MEIRSGWRNWKRTENQLQSCGTHVDAPIHFAEEGQTIDQIPLHAWIGPAVKIDVVSKWPDYAKDAGVEDLQIKSIRNTHRHSIL